MKKIFISFIVVCSCSKQSALRNNLIDKIDKYQCIIDSYDADTSTFNRILWAQYYLPIEKNGGMDTIKDIMFLNCNTLRIDHIYYKMNDKKVFSFEFPKINPEKTDTNFINYNLLKK